MPTLSHPELPPRSLAALEAQLSSLRTTLGLIHKEIDELERLIAAYKRILREGERHE